MSETMQTSAPMTVDERLELLAAQVSFLVEEAERQRKREEQRSELSHDLAPLARQGMDSAARELEELGISVEEIFHLVRTIMRALPSLDASVRQLESLPELGQDVAPLSTLAVGLITERLQVAEEKGYLAFAKSGAGIVDRIVTSYTEEDVQALGENVVLILDTIKEMTQPEVMTMLRRTFQTVSEHEVIEPPSTWSLLREMRDPEVRRGLSRILTMLRSVGEIDNPNE